MGFSAEEEAALLSAASCVISTRRSMTSSIPRSIHRSTQHLHTKQCAASACALGRDEISNTMFASSRFGSSGFGSK